MNMDNRDILDVLKWFNNPDNMKGTDTVAWVPRRVIAAAIAEIRDLRERNENSIENSSSTKVVWLN